MGTDQLLLIVQAILAPFVLARYAPGILADATLYIYGRQVLMNLSITGLRNRNILPPFPCSLDKSAYTTDQNNETKTYLEPLLNPRPKKSPREQPTRREYKNEHNRLVLS